MDGCTAIIFGKTCQNWIAQVGVACAFAGTFTRKQQVMHLHCFVSYNKTWMKTVLTCFTKMTAEQPSLTQHERPMYRMKEKYATSSDNNFMICLFDFERFSIESRFPPFSFSFYSHYTARIKKKFTLPPPPV